MLSCKIPSIKQYELGVIIILTNKQHKNVYDVICAPIVVHDSDVMGTGHICVGNISAVDLFS